MFLKKNSDIKEKQSTLIFSIALCCNSCVEAVILSDSAADVESEGSVNQKVEEQWGQEEETAFIDSI